MPPTIVADDATPGSPRGDGPPPDGGADPTGEPPGSTPSAEPSGGSSSDGRAPGLVERARGALGLSEVHAHGFFDDKPLLADDVDRRSVRRDGTVFVIALLAGVFLAGGMLWVGLKVIANHQNKSEAATVNVAKTAKGGPATDRRSVTLSTTTLPAGPGVGAPIVLPVLTDNTASVAATVLYDGSTRVDRHVGLAPSVTWTPKTPGEHHLKVVLEIANGARAASPAITVDVGDDYPGTSDVSNDVVHTAQRLVDAINGHDWAALRAIDPTKSGYRDDRLTNEYDGLENDILVPVTSVSRSGGVTRLYAGLVAHETHQTELFCVRWDVNPTAGTASQVFGRRLSGSHPADAPVSDVEQQLVDSCGVS
ncbi:MAG TPA: hypothetical protein VHA73_11200 [Acidimicrobiales bacterium]|jgi:hypothetical protein|nr:hypothetical protein [Acidimicrobiales bacterium]